MATPEVALGPTSASLPGAGPAGVDKQRIFVASQWQLMWWRFRKHKVAVASALVVIGFYAGRGGRGFPRVRRPQRLRGPALAHAPAARPFVRRLALQPLRLRGQGSP